MPRVTFSAFSVAPNGVDEATRTLRGVIVASKGEAKGHGLYLGERALTQLAKLKSVPFRVDPPTDDVHGGAMAIEGEATNFRRDGNDIRADVQLMELPTGKWAQILKLAKTVPHLIGMSLDLTYRVIGEMAGKLKEILPIDVRSIDLVDQPASARALFAQPAVDTTGDGMNYEFLRKQCEKFCIAFPATDAEVTPEIATKAQTDLEAKLTALQTDATSKLAAEKTAGELQVKLAEAEKKIPAPLDENKIIDGVVAKLQAKGLAMAGGKPAPGDPAAEAEAQKTAGIVKLTAKVSGLAVKLKQKPEDLVAKFSKLSESEQATCLSLNLDPDEFAAQKAKYGKVAESMPV